MRSKRGCLFRLCLLCPFLGVAVRFWLHVGEMGQSKLVKALGPRFPLESSDP